MGSTMHFRRVPVIEWNFGKFLDFFESQSWMINFRIRVCIRTADSQVTMIFVLDQKSGDC